MEQEILSTIFKKHDVKIAYVFGSQQQAGVAFLSGEGKVIEESSDLDIGVVFGRLPGQPFDVYGGLYADLSGFFEPFSIDLVFLQESSPMFQYEAISGTCVYCDDENFFDEYEERVMKTASDLKYKKDIFEQDFLEAVKDGYFEIAHR